MQPQNNLTYVPYYQPLSSPKLPFQQGQMQQPHQFNLSKPTNNLGGQLSMGQAVFTSTTNVTTVFPTVNTLNYSNMPFQNTNALIHQKTGNMPSNSTGNTNYLKQTILNSAQITTTGNTAGGLQNSNLVNSIALNDFQNNQNIQTQNQMQNSRNTRSPTSKGAGPLATLRSSSSKHSNEISNDKQFDIKAYINSKSFAGNTTFDSKPIFLSSLTTHFQPSTLNNFITSSNNITTANNQKQNSQTNNQEIQIINRNGFFEVNCESIHQQSSEILNKLKGKQLSLQNVKQLISEVKSLETKYSELYNKLCSNYEEVLMGKQIPQNKITPTLGDIPQVSNGSSQIEIEQNPSITITPIETENKILKINKFPQNLKFLGEYDPSITQPRTTTAATTIKEDNKIPVINVSNDVAIVLNAIKGDSKIQKTGNYEKAFKTETDEDPSDQYSKEEIKQRFLAINDNDTPQLLSIPGDTKKKISNSPKKYSFDVSNFPRDYQSSDEIERLIQQYKQSGMSKSGNHEERKQNQDNEGQKKPNTRGNSVSYIKQESSEVQEEKSESINTLKVVQNQQEKRKLSDIVEASKDNTAKKESGSKAQQDQQQSKETQQQISYTTATAGSSSPGTNKSSKKGTTQDLLERVNNVLQRSDLFLMKHSDKKLKKGQSKNFNNVTADDAVASMQKQEQQQIQKEYDQSSEIKAIMDQIKRKSDYTLNGNAQTINQEKEVRQNLIIKFSEQSPKNEDNSQSSSKNRENRSISDYSAEKKKEQTRTSIQNVAVFIKKSAVNTPQSNQAVYGSAANSEQNNINSPQSVTSCQPISHEANQAKSTFSKLANYTQNATQFGSFAFSSPKNTLGINELLNKYSSSVNNSPKTGLQQKDYVDYVAENNLNQEQSTSNQNSIAPSLVQSPQVLVSFVSQASPAINLSESATSCKKEEKAESVINSQKNSQLKSQLSDLQSPAANVHDSEKTTAFSPRNFQTHINTTAQKTPQSEQAQIQDKGISSQQLEIKQENLSSFARNIGQSGVFSPSSFSSNQSVAVQVIANNTAITQPQEEQPTIHPFLKQAVSSEPQSEKLTHENIKKQLQESQNFQVELYEELDPFSYSIENFKVGKKLGHGKFADVYAAVDKHTGFRVALKQIKKDTINEFNLYQDILNEIKVQGILSHPNIIQLYGFFIDNDSIYLIQELALGKELFTELKSTVYKKFTENLTSFYVKQVIEALIYMHSKNVVHRDLKPENIMVHNGLLKICDFGYAAIVQKNKMRSTFCGTLDYVSPEMVQGKSYDFSVDVWSVGILTYELLIGHAPFAAKSHDATFDQILNGELRFSGPISFDAGDFISKILEREPNSRMNLTQAIQHPFIQNEYIRRLQSEQGGEIDFADFKKL